VALTRQYAEKKARSSSGGKDTLPADLEPQVSDAAGRKAKALKEGMDEILEDIDEVLTQNAEEFVAAYVQKGGE
jgi:prokaryotic ubiquitin-like protein Pup